MVTPKPSKLARAAAKLVHAINLGCYGPTSLPILQHRINRLEGEIKRRDEIDSKFRKVL